MILVNTEVLDKNRLAVDGIAEEVLSAADPWYAEAVHRDRAMMES